jgi:hypothetical protein
MAEYLCHLCGAVYSQVSGAVGDRLSGCRSAGCGGRPVRVPDPVRIRWIVDALAASDSYWTGGGT